MKSAGKEALNVAETKSIHTSMACFQKFLQGASSFLYAASIFLTVGLRHILPIAKMFKTRQELMLWHLKI